LLPRPSRSRGGRPARTGPALVHAPASRTGVAVGSGVFPRRGGALQRALRGPGGGGRLRLPRRPRPGGDDPQSAARLRSTPAPDTGPRGRGTVRGGRADAGSGAGPVAGGASVAAVEPVVGFRPNRRGPVVDGFLPERGVGDRRGPARPTRRERGVPTDAGSAALRRRSRGERGPRGAAHALRRGGLKRRNRPPRHVDGDPGRTPHFPRRTRARVARVGGEAAAATPGGSHHAALCRRGPVG